MCFFDWSKRIELWVVNGDFEGNERGNAVNCKYGKSDEDQKP